MKILLIGEYSNVHWTLAEGLRSIGHDVTVLSNGDFWKDYPRDIDLSRIPTKIGGYIYVYKLLKALPRLCHFDIVQLINPMFLELKAEKMFHIYKYLRRNNKKVILGGFGMDYFWVSTCCEEKPFRYSDFNIGNELRTNIDAIKERRDWLGTSKEKLNKYIADSCDGIVTGLYEYWVCYHPKYPNKTVYIPFPIKIDNKSHINDYSFNKKINIFIGINKLRSAYKGTDIMFAAAKDLTNKYQDKINLRIAESVPFNKYVELLNNSDIILDQLYSYTPSMNSLLAMSKGIICVGGGEAENYEIISENKLRPIINVVPSYESVYTELEKLILHPEKIPELKRQSVEYVCKHHDYMHIAKQYEKFYNNILS